MSMSKYAEQASVWTAAGFDLKLVDSIFKLQGGKL